MAVKKKTPQQEAREANRRNIPTTPPPGTVRIIGSQNGAGVAYDANGNALGIVQASLRPGATVFYSGGANPTPIQIQGVGQDAPTTTFTGEPLPGSAPPGGGTPPPPRFDGYTPDSFYDEAMSTIAANRRRALDAATEGEKGLASDFGLGITQDDSGARFTGTWAASDASRGGIDPSNPFSRASLLNKSYFTAGRIGEGSYANRGLLTSGAYQRSQQRDAFGFEQGRDQLLKQFASSLQGYRDRRAEAESDAELRRRQASLDLYGRNRDNYDRTYPS